MKSRSVIFLFAVLLACDETDECKQLRTVETHWRNAVAIAKARTALRKQSEARLAKYEAKAKETKALLGLDLPEAKLQEILDARVAKIAGATIERTTRQVDAATDGEGAVHETAWRIKFAAKDDADGFAQLDALAGDKPLFLVVTLLRDEKGRWLLELQRASVVEVPMNVQPTPLPVPKRASEIKEELGFCGAGDLRKSIAELEQQWDQVKVDAEELTVLMPKMATYEGLQRRAQLVGEVEVENRRLIREFANAIKSSKVRFRAVGVERAVVIYEFYGGQKERSLVDRKLPEDLLKGIKELPSATKNVVRLSVVNRVADEQLKKSSGAMRPGVGLAPENHE